MMCGGPSAGGAPDEDCHKYVAELRSAAEEKNGAKFEEFTAVHMKTQVVAGTNYFVKVRVHPTSGEHIHLRIYKPLPHTGQGAQLSGIQKNKKADDDLAYFE